MLLPAHQATSPFSSSCSSNNRLLTTSSRCRAGRLVRVQARLVSDRPKAAAATAAPAVETDAFGRAHQQQQQQLAQRDAGDSSTDASPPTAAAHARSNVVPFRRRVSAVTLDAPDAATNTRISTSSSSTAVADPSLDSSSSSSSSGCPFRQAFAAPAAPQQPPLVKLTWWQRVWQITQPFKMQSLVLDETLEAGGSMVQLEQQLAFEDAYVPGTGAAVRVVLAGDSGSDPTSGPSLVPFFVRLMGQDSLLVQSGPKHKYLRGLLAPAFSPEAVAGYLPQIQQLVQRHLESWAAAGEEGVKGCEALELLTFDFIVEPPELLSLHTTYQSWINGLPAWPWLNIPFTPYASALTARHSMMQHFQAAVVDGRARMEAGEEVEGILGDMLAAVDEEGNRLTDSQICDNILLLLLPLLPQPPRLTNSQICDNILLLLFAGHATSSSTLALCLANLQDCPAALRALRAEQRGVVAQHGQGITAAALRDMLYTEAVIRETLRLDPVVQMLFRVATRDFTLAGHTVPAGKQLLLPLKHLAAHEPRWAPAAAGSADADGKEGGGQWAPEVFAPERLLTPAGQKAGDLMPFGHGARYCLGSGLALAEMKVLLALLARHYSFTADTDTEWHYTISKVPKNGLPLVIQPLET